MDCPGLPPGRRADGLLADPRTLSLEEVRFIPGASRGEHCPQGRARGNPEHVRGLHQLTSCHLLKGLSRSASSPHTPKSILKGFQSPSKG